MRMNSADSLANALELDVQISRMHKGGMDS